MCDDEELTATPDDEPAEPEPEERSVMRELLDPEDATRCEVVPGRWYLPGTPP